MPSVIEIVPKDGIPDVKGERTAKYIRDFMGVPVDSVGTRTLYFFTDDIQPDQAERYARVLLADNVVEDFKFLWNSPVYEQPEIPDEYKGAWVVRVGYKQKPLIMDNWGKAARLALERIFGVELGSVRKIDEYEIRGDLSKEQIMRICSEEKLADSKVQSYIMIPGGGNDGKT